MSKTFKYAGVSRHKGKMSFRASNRPNPTYPNILKKDGHTDIEIVELSKAMTKEEARKNLTTRKNFQTPEILACLRQVDKDDAAQTSTAKKNVSKPAKAKKPTAAKKPSKKKDKEPEAGVEDTVLVTEDDAVDLAHELGPAFLKHTSEEG